MRWVVKMHQNLVPADLAENPVYRRTWLLLKALESDPLGPALELARVADEFVTAGGPPQHGAVNKSTDARPTSDWAEPFDGPERTIEVEKHARAATFRAQLSE